MEPSQVEFDRDLAPLSVGELRCEIMRLRAGIRLHRDQRGDDRCWLDDVQLYMLLPEREPADFRLPCREQFLSSCARFWATRQEQSNPELHRW